MKILGNALMLLKNKADCFLRFIKYYWRKYLSIKFMRHLF